MMSNPDVPDWAKNVYSALVGYAWVSQSYLWCTSTAVEWLWSSWFLCTWAPSLLWSGFVLPHLSNKKKELNVTNTRVNNISRKLFSDATNNMYPDWVLKINESAFGYALISTFYLWDTSTAVEWGWGVWFLCTWAPAFLWGMIFRTFFYKDAIKKRHVKINVKLKSKNIT